MCRLAAGVAIYLGANCQDDRRPEPVPQVLQQGQRHERPCRRHDRLWRAANLDGPVDHFTGCRRPVQQAGQPGGGD
ncbi:hypothetical protein D3C78_1783330 [compost metagenome]